MYLLQYNVKALFEERGISDLSLLHLNDGDQAQKSSTAHAGSTTALDIS